MDFLEDFSTGAQFGGLRVYMWDQSLSTVEFIVKV